MSGSRVWVGVLLAAFWLAACGGGRPVGPDGGDGNVSTGTTGQDGGLDGGDLDGGGDEDAEPPPPRLRYAAVRGTVWAPGNAPGMVPSGQEIPVFGALVYLTPERPEPIPDGVFCQRCQEPPAGAAVGSSDHEGNFTVGSILPGDYWLVVEKGLFRLERQISIAEGEIVELPAELTTLPSIHNPAIGNWVPRIAVATGNFDKLEDVLGKMGIGSLASDYTFTEGLGSDRIDFYVNGGRADLMRIRGDLSQLVSDRERLMSYHIVFIPCAGGLNTRALQNVEVLRNLRDYVREGGKLYVTDWSGEWHDNVFPAFVRLEGSTEDTPPEAFDAGDLSDPSDDTWDTSLFGDANGSLYDAEDGEAADEDLRQWLDGQMAPEAESSAVSAVDASRFLVADNWNTILETPSVQVGVDDEGLPVYEEAKAWVIGSSPHASGSGKLPMTVTYEPTGCGRVLFTTYHTTPDAHAGLVPQERVLLYLILEIGICKSGPVLL